MSDSINILAYLLHKRVEQIFLSHDRSLSKLYTYMNVKIYAARALVGFIKRAPMYDMYVYRNFPQHNCFYCTIL